MAKKKTAKKGTTAVRKKIASAGRGSARSTQNTKKATKAKKKAGGKKGAPKTAKDDQGPSAKTGDVIWTELQSTDPSRAAGFYATLLGWKTKSMPMPGVEYTVFSSNGIDFGGVLGVPQPGMPSNWLTYFRVRSTEKSAERATELGGQVIAPPFHVPTVGHMAVIQDPTGAYFALFQTEM